MKKNIWCEFSFILRLISLCGLLGSLAGCATRQVFEWSQSVENIPPKLLINDQIIAFAHADAFESGQNAEERPLFVYLGKENTYFLQKGGDEILHLLQQMPMLNAEKLQVVPSSQDDMLFLNKEKDIWGQLSFSYDTRGRRVNKKELKALNRLGFVAQEELSNQVFRKTIQISGFIKPNTDLIIKNKESDHLKAEISLALYQQKEEKTHTNPIVLLLTPISFVVDVLLLPVYLVGLVGYLLLDLLFDFVWEGKSHRW